MFNQVTYNVLIERFKAFASGHYKIERFSHGQIDVTDIDKEQRFPWMHVVPVTMQPSSGSRSFTLDVVFADMPRDKENKTEYQRESLSDCMQLAEDLLAEIKNGGVIFGEDVTLEEGSAVQPFMEEYTHVLTGVTLSLTLTFPWNWSACDIPADWSTGGSSGGGSGGNIPALVLKVNSVDNAVQTILNLVNGTNTTVEDLGDGRVRINSTGGITSVSWGDIVGNIADQLDLALWFNEKADVSSLAEVAFTGDYDDLKNKPTIPDASTFVPYTGATANVNIGGNKFIADDGSDNSQMSPSLFGVQNSDTTKYSYLDKTGLNVVDTAAGDTMNVNAGGLTFPDATSQYSAAVNADWNSISGLSEILNKPIVPTELNDLNDVNVSSPNDGDTLIYFSSGNEFKNQPLAAVATSGDYNDLINTPTLPPVIGDMLKSVYDTDTDGVVDAAERIEIIVRNSTGVTLSKGQVVYLSGATGNRPNALLADASTEATSSKTIGFVVEDIPDNSDGSVAVNGTLHDLDTSAFSAGDTLWLSETAGAWQANTPPAEPAHAVFLGYVARSHPNLGRVVIQIQNGYELNELHGVQISSEANNEALLFESSTGLWKNKPISSSVISDANDVGKNLLTLANPSAIRYLRVNADNSISTLSAAQLKAELGFITQVQTTQLTNSSTTAGVNISGCIVALEANTNYTGRMFIASGSVPVVGFTLTFDFPAGTSVLTGRINSSSATTAQVMSWIGITSGVALSPNFGPAQNQGGYSEIQFYISVGSTAGNFTPSFRSGSTGSAITIYANLTSIQLQKL
jgi:hypothetical protein